MFFCGAGISYQPGLPGFKGLVDEVYRLVGTTRTAIEQDAYARYQFDATLICCSGAYPASGLQYGPR